MGERSLAQVAHDAYWRATSSVVTPWDEVQGMFKGAWAAAAAACAQQEREATETQRFLATKFEARCTELERDIESARSMNAVLRTQLAEARELRAGQAAWIADEDGGHTLVLAQEVADVGTTLSGRVAWRGERSALTCDGWLAIGDGESEKEAILRAQRIIEAVAGVRP